MAVTLGAVVMTLGAVTMRVLAVLAALARLTMIVLAAVIVTGVRAMCLAVTALGSAVVGNSNPLKLATLGSGHPQSQQTGTKRSPTQRRSQRHH